MRCATGTRRQRWRLATGVAVLLTAASTLVVAAAPASAAVPSAPTEITAVLSGSDGISVSFRAPASNGGKVIAGYRAHCWSDTGGVSRTVFGSSGPIRVGRLTRGSRYRCVVRAVNGDGVGVASLRSAPLILPGPPSAPLVPTVKVGTRQNARVSFGPPQSDGTSPIIRYVARCSSGTDVSLAGGSASPVYTKPLIAGLTYRCQVRALNEYGYGPWSTGSAPFTVGEPTDDGVSMAAGTGYSCAWHQGVVKCWGDNNSGELGLGDTSRRGDGSGEMGDALPTVKLGTGRTAKSVAAGSNHNCAVLDDHTVKCWGYNGAGHLGLGDGNERGDGPGEMGDALPRVQLGTGRTAKSLTAGFSHTCALLDNDAVKCWGQNSLGMLGLGDIINRGGAPGEMGDALPSVQLGTGRTAKALAAGYQHTCALLDNGSVKCWGDGLRGALGLGDPGNRGDGPGEMGDNLPSVDLGTGRTALMIAAGAYHTCALLDDHTVKCWGMAAEGQLGLGSKSTRGTGPGQMGDLLPPVDLGAGHSAKAVSAKGWHTCALLDDDTVKCWGMNGLGQLGLGDQNNRGDDPGEMGDTLPAVDLGTGHAARNVVAGLSHTCAVLDDSTIRCWGENTLGQLGLGDQYSRGDGPGEMGDALQAVDLGSGWP
jgi:alpha-tubulin suppressor-like RCC1 family protein